MDRGVRTQIEHKGAADLFEEVKPVFLKSDFVAANLECPVTKVRQPVHKRFVFRGEPEWLPELKMAGITHLVMANNHSYDQGRTGIEETATHLQKNKLISVGYGSTQENACEPVLLKKGNLNVALFSSVLLPLENWSYLPDSPGICQASANDLKEKIKVFKLKNEKTFVVLILHWGTEFQEHPSGEQRQQAAELIEAGADAIIGHHPHVIQKKAVLNGKPVFYSVGNFVFDQSAAQAKKGLLVELKFSGKGMDFKETAFSIENCKPYLQKN